MMNVRCPNVQKSKIVFFVAALLFAFVAQAARTTRASFKITSFNIEWFGLGGDMKGSPDQEHRIASIRDFLDENFSDTDVFAFQEIVDLDALSQVLPKDWSCLSYESSNTRHQHIVLCHRGEFVFVREPGDDNDIIDDVAIEGARSRPALRILLKRKGGKPFVRIVAVHLKAFPDRSQVRVQQAEAIAKALSGSKLAVPNIILGDFNAYKAEKTGLKEDDANMIDKAFKKQKLGLKRLPHSEPNTYRKGNYEEQLDHIWISSTVPVVNELKTWTACNKDPRGQSGFKNIDYYNEHVSDHCPISVGLGL